MMTLIFVCHGNICRSTMAEFLFRDMVKKAGREEDFEIFSRATSAEELGNPVHPGTARILDRLGISYQGKYAQRITKAECDRADLILVMDEKNRRGLAPFLGNNGRKVHSLLSYAGLSRDIADPWWTGDFEETYRDVRLGLEGLWKAIR